MSRPWPERSADDSETPSCQAESRGRTAPDELCVKRAKTEQAFRRESYTQNESAELTLGDPGCSPTRARVWSSRVGDPYTLRRVRSARSVGRFHPSTARAAVVMRSERGMSRVSPWI
jgi:hypothetical protein